MQRYELHVNLSEMFTLLGIIIKIILNYDERNIVQPPSTYETMATSPVETTEHL